MSAENLKERDEERLQGIFVKRTERETAVGQELFEGGTATEPRPFTGVNAVKSTARDFLTIFGGQTVDDRRHLKTGAALFRASTAIMGLVMTAVGLFTLFALSNPVVQGAGLAAALFGIALILASHRG